MKKCLMTAVLAVTCTATAETYYVSPDGNDSARGTSWETAKQTIQAAINAATMGDKVVVTNGIYAPVSVSGNRLIIIESVNGAEETIIDGGGTNRCATLGTAFGHTKTVLTGFTLQNGYTPSFGGGSYYGTLSNCTLMANLADVGGGAYYSTLNNCALMGNMATNTSFGFGGGGAYGGTLNNCTLTGNMAASRGGGSCFGTLNNCTLTENTAEVGGGTYSGTLYNCTLTGNTARGNGGGVYNGMLNNCTLTGNRATNGGGVYHDGGTNCTCTLNNCTLTGNAVRGSGGGAYNCRLNNCLLVGNGAGGNGGGAYNGMLNNCTLANNRATDGGGVYRGGGTNSICILKNCIVWENVHTSGKPDNNNYATNDKLYPVRLFKTHTKPSPFGGVKDPCFVDAANGNFRLKANSPCINHGNDKYVVGVCDLDGKLRIWGSTVDIGAYEFEDVPAD